MKRNVISLVLAAALTAAALTGCAGFNGDEVVAQVDDAQITAGVANFYARYQQAMTETYYAAYMGDDMWSGEASEGVTYEESVKDSIMESLERLYILDAHKADYQVELTEEEQTAIGKAAEKFADANGLEETEAISGDEATVEKVLELLTIQEKMYAAMTADVDTEVSDEEAAQKSMQYVSFPLTSTDDEGNTVTLEGEELEALKQTAEEFREGAASAEDFETYASDAGYEATSVTFDDETTSIPTLLLAAADVLEEGELTEVVEDESALYVAKLTSLLDRDATDAKKETIVSQRRSEQYENLCTEWTDAAKISVKDDVWAKISFIKQGVTIKENSEE